MSSEDEFTIGVFLHGENIYEFKKKKIGNYYCILCSKKVKEEEYLSAECCPICKYKYVIALDAKDSFNRFQIKVLREKIILGVLDSLEYEEEEFE